MKFPIAYYLLLLYLTVMLRPLLPVMGDAWGHTFNETIHIATVHAKYGANHVQSVLADNAAQHANNDKNQPAGKPVPASPWHVAAKTSTDNLPTPTIIKHHAVFQVETPTGFTSATTPPPKNGCRYFLA